MPGEERHSLTLDYDLVDAMTLETFEFFEMEIIVVQIAKRSHL